MRKLCGVKVVKGCFAQKIEVTILRDVKMILLGLLQNTSTSSLHSS
jgi:hypothetical protein